MGLTWARHHSAGSLPVWMERSKMTWIIGAISSHNSFNKMGLSLSGPAAFPGFRFFSSFSMPATEMLKSSMTGVDFCISGGSNSEGILPLSAASWSFILHNRERDSGSLVVKTDWKWRLCMSAFSAVFVTNFWPWLRAVLPSWSCFEHLRNEKSFFVSHIEFSSFNPRRPSR